MTTQTERELIKLDFEQRQRAEQLLDEVATEEGRLSELVYELISLRDQAGRASVQQGEPVAWLEHHKAGDACWRRGGST